MGDSRGTKLAVLELTADEREASQGLARRPKTAQVLALRARIGLACADGLSNSEVSRQLGVSLPTRREVAQAFRHRPGGVIDSAETPGGCWTHFSHVRAGATAPSKPARPSN